MIGYTLSYICFDQQVRLNNFVRWLEQTRTPVQHRLFQSAHLNGQYYLLSHLRQERLDEIFKEFDKL